MDCFSKIKGKLKDGTFCTESYIKIWKKSIYGYIKGKIETK